MHIELIAELAYILIVILVCLRIVYDVSASSKTLAYLLFVVFVPVIGMIVYFAIGNNYRKNKLYSKKLTSNKRLYEAMKARLTESSTSIIKAQESKGLNGNSELAYFLLNGRSPLTENNEVKLLHNGEETFPEICKALENAAHHIHMEYYIYEDDNIGNKIKEILIRKAKEGIQVRFIYDDFGSHSIGKKLTTELKENGVEVYPFYEITFFHLANRINYRDHRKIVIVDGIYSFVGGINVSDKYINPSPDNVYWRDTHMMIHGLATRHLQYIFLCDWNFCSSQKVKIEPQFFPVVNEKTGDTLVQIAASGPDSDEPTIMYSIMQAVALAKKEILITSPYFIPGESMMDTLRVAALSGIKVQLLAPEKSDSWLVNAAAYSYYGDLLDAGVEIYLYTKGFVHAKTLVVDGVLSMVGTANMDSRSFELNFEVNAVVYNEAFSQELRNYFYDDLKTSLRINKQQWDARSLWKILPEKIARLLSSLL